MRPTHARNGEQTIFEFLLDKDDPQVLTRVLGLLAQRNIFPAWLEMDAGDRLAHLRIGITVQDPHLAHSITSLALRNVSVCAAGNRQTTDHIDFELTNSGQKDWAWSATPDVQLL